MQKVDRLGWTTGFSLKQYGARVGLRSNSSQALERAKAVLRPSGKIAPAGTVDTLISLWEPPPSKLRNAQGYHLLYWNEARTVRSLHAEAVFEGLEELIDVCLATYSRKWYFLQAGVVQWKGRALLLPGASLRAKPTLARALTQAGLSVYSEQFAVVDPQGRVHPYSRPGQPDGEPLPIGTILFSKYKPGAPFAAQRLSPGLAALQLLRHALPVRYKPKEVLPLIAGITTGAACYQANRGEARQWVQSILSLE